jgi:hypothetical protein
MFFDLHHALGTLRAASLAAGKKFMAIDGAYPKRPVVSQRRIAPYLMVNPGKHPAELVRVDPSQNLPYPIRAGFFLAD